jgi:hypothetical protein
LLFFDFRVYTLHPTLHALKVKNQGHLPYFFSIASTPNLLWLRGKEIKSSGSRSSFLTGPYPSDNLFAKGYWEDVNGRTGFFRIWR